MRNFIVKKASSVKMLTRQEEVLTDSNTDFGTLIHDVRLAMMGKSAPNIDVARMMKTDPMRRPAKVSAPPPSPQFKSDMALAVKFLRV